MSFIGCRDHSGPVSGLEMVGILYQVKNNVSCIGFGVNKCPLSGLEIISVLYRV